MTVMLVAYGLSYKHWCIIIIIIISTTTIIMIIITITIMIIIINVNSGSQIETNLIYKNSRNKLAYKP